MKEKFKFQNIVVVTFALLLAFAIAFACVFSHIGGVCNAATDFKTVGKSAYMVDYATGTVLYARGENERLPIASMVKIMTSLLTLECVDSGKLALMMTLLSAKMRRVWADRRCFWMQTQLTKSVIC